MVSINVLTENNGILTQANNAKTTTKNRGAEEKVKLAVIGARADDGTLTVGKLTSELANYGGTVRGTEFPIIATVDGKKFNVDVNGKVTLIENNDDGNGTRKISEVTSSYVEKNTTVEDEYGNAFMLPEGFKVRKDATTNNADTVDKGIVIEDRDGNQFVWIPVGTFKKDKNGTTEEVILERYSFASDGTPSNYTGNYTEDTAESHKSGYGNAIAKNINHFISKANSNHGYYIGRYEAGVENGILDTSSMSNNYTAPDKNWTGYKSQEGKKLKLVCKSGQQPWNYVTQNKASELSRTMYTEKTYESDLINSYAWDTAIVFIQKCGTKTNSKKYSKQGGQLINTSAPSITGTGLLKDTNAVDEQCNIYDMAGNAYEWTTETSDNSYNCCVYRGGLYSYSFDCTSSRSYYFMTGAIIYSSFRPLLYL